MKRILLFAALLSILVLGIGCGAFPSATQNAAPAPAEGYSVAPEFPPMPAAAPTMAPMATAAPAQPKALLGAGANQDAIAQADAQRMIVYTGSLSLQVNDTAETVNKITDLLKSVNGYVSSRSLVAYDKDKLRGTIVVRIPAAALETTLAQIKALSVKVLREDAASNDVTEEYVDLAARLKNLQAYEVELTKLLDTVRERTGKAEDILAVYNQLTEVRGQIEQIQGRQKYLENTSTLATYTIEFVPVEEIVVEGKPGWDPSRTAGRALDQLVGAMQALGDLAINFVLLVLPLLVIMLLPLVILVWLIRIYMRRRTPKKALTA